MKKLEELGISPAPWFVDVDGKIGCNYISNAIRPNEMRMRIVAKPNCNFDEHRADANLIAAAPELYECLREAIAESCISYCGDSPIHCPKNPGECFVQKWRDALRKASGESEVADGK